MSPLVFQEQELVQLARRGQLKGVVTKPARYSATTIQNFIDCERKYYWPTIAGLEAPPSTAQQFGTKLHSFQEEYLRKGILPPRGVPEGVLASIGLPLLPAPTTKGLYVEEQFEARFEGIPVSITGTRDFGVDPQERDAKGFLLGDHKTAGSKRYPKTKEWLHGNVQSNLYAYTKWAELAAKGFDRLGVVDKQWIYYYKAEKSAEKLRIVDSLDHVAEQFESVIKPAVIGMANMVSAAPKVGDVKHADESVCEMYGGCPHRARCFGMGLKGDNMGLLAGKFTKAAITAKTQGAGTAINPPPPTRQAPKLVKAEEPEEAVEAAEEAAQEEETSKKTRKPKGAEKLVADTAAAVEKAFTPKMQGSASKRTPGANSAHDYWLFVDCDPTYGFAAAVTPIEKIVGAAQADAAEGLQSAHYRYGPPQGGSNYGVLEAAFASWLEQNPLVGAIKVDSGSIVSRDVIGLLRAHATAIVEGRRV